MDYKNLSKITDSEKRPVEQVLKQIGFINEDGSFNEDVVKEVLTKAGGKYKDAFYGSNPKDRKEFKKAVEQVLRNAVLSKAEGTEFVKNGKVVKGYSIGVYVDTMPSDWGVAVKVSAADIFKDYTAQAPVELSNDEMEEVLTKAGYRVEYKNYGWAVAGEEAPKVMVCFKD